MEGKLPSVKELLAKHTSDTIKGKDQLEAFLTTRIGKGCFEAIKEAMQITRDATIEVAWRNPPVGHDGLEALKNSPELEII